ncbi:Alpha/Beta hydrolase protein [Endogone sp. FLAS-F59071]|nr:Alpha/Beta hydrolase protein [Endogone sp. FLAS-F59071]|eukprot:RUS16448.1 Alpha/Beta hydrolase protein [Endogone sp. FLAS-F59071]
MASNSVHAPPTPITEQVHLPGNCILHVTRLGTGPIPVVCLHGGPGLWDYFSSLTPRLTSLATVHTYDQRSCGRSFPAPPPYTIATWIADLERLRVHWGVNRWVLLGHSFGATFALAIPERCHGLIYVSGTGVADPGWHGRYRANRTTLLGEEGARELQEIKHKVKERPATVVPRAFAVYQTLERQACEMSWATDFACYATEPERARQMVREQLLNKCYWSPNFEVNRLLGEDAEKFAEKEDFDAKHRLDVALREVPVLAGSAWGGRSKACGCGEGVGRKDTRCPVCEDVGRRTLAVA